MPEALDLPCPFCRQTVHVEDAGADPAVSCPYCGASIPLLDLSERRTKQFENVQPVQAPQDFHLPAYDDLAGGESRWSAASLQHRSGGETLAVLALLIPVIALCLPVHSVTTAILLGWGTVLLTTILLGIDAASMGTIDMHGNRQMTVTGLCLGMFLLWILFYPLAYFRRRHFGRPNLGLLAVLVAGLFFLVPFFKEYSIDDDKPPACTRPEVIGLVNDLIRQSPIGPRVKAISGHREIRYDEASNTRRGRCLIQTNDGERIPIVFVVTWIGKDRRAFQVQVVEEQPADPP